MLSLKEFLTGSLDKDIIIDSVFEKSLPSILEDYAVPLQFRGACFNYRIHQVPEGLSLYINNNLAGVYVGCNIAIAPKFQKQGLGSRLILSYFSQYGSLPTWHHDKAGFSPNGYKAHRAAWSLYRSRENKISCCLENYSSISVS